MKSYEQVEDSTVRCIMKAFNILELESSLSRVDLFAKVLMSAETENDAAEYAGSLFIEIYLCRKFPTVCAKVLVGLEISIEMAYVEKWVFSF